MNPWRTASGSSGRDLHLLSIEGWGIRAMSALIILKEVLRQYQYLHKLPELPRPCDVFDLAGGTGTGGIIVIMLFRLCMTVDQAISALQALFKDVFSKRNAWSTKNGKATRLEHAMAEIIYSSLTNSVEETKAREVPMLDDKVTRCFVSATTAKNVSAPTLFRTYVSRRHSSHNCSIVEATRATTAEDPYFPSIDIGDDDLKETFIYAGLRWGNPVKSVLEEAVAIFPAQRIFCVLSIGTGKQSITGFEASSTIDFVKVLKKVANDSEPISEEVAKQLSENNTFYCRLNVDQGLQDIGFEQWEKLGSVKTHTEKYLQKYDVVQKVDKLLQVLNSRAVVISTVEQTLGGLGTFLDALGLPWRRWSTVISEFIQTVEPSKEAAEALNVQIALLRDSLDSCLQGRGLTQLPEELKASIERLLGRFVHVFKNPLVHTNDQRDPMVEVIKNTQRLLQRFWVENQIAGNIMIHDVLKYVQNEDSVKKAFIRLEQHTLNQNLQNLNVAPSGAYNSYEISQRVSCFTGTRVKLLNEIGSWISSNAQSVAPIYILDGVAGIGKSTIAKTIAEKAADINALGASFFFSRDEEKRKTAKSFFPSTAYQLAYYDEDFANQIDESLRSTPHAVTQSLFNQFSTMILKPLRDSFSAGNPVLLVIDALDECADGGDVLLKILADAINQMPRLKVFITTRPEHHIRSILDRYQHLQRFHLQDIETSVVQSDIRLYLDFHLSEIQVHEVLPDLKRPWIPTKKDVEMLIGISGTLFIIAATATKFILDSKRTDPAKQLSRLLSGVSPKNFSGSKYTTVMDSFYTQILLSAIPDDFFDEEEEDDWFTRYRLVVGSIVMLQVPLPCQSLSVLLGLASEDVVGALSHLHSLVAPAGEDMVFRVHHKSFPDFVTSPLRCRAAPKFLIDPVPHHLRLGKQCLKTMISFLRPNICNLSLPDLFRDHTEAQDVAQNHISPELAYASTQWSTHLAGVGIFDGETEQLLEQFAQNHLLVWLEVLAIIQKVDVAYSSLDRIAKLLERSETSRRTISEMFRDGCRFIALNINLLRHARGHVYSAFAFVPQDTRLFRTYKRWDGIKFRVVAGYEKTWDPTLISVMAEHTETVNFATFSKDGSKLASASDDGTVRIWDSQTGGEIAVLRDHSHAVKLVAYFPDDSKLATASEDGTIQLWDSQSHSKLAVLGNYQHAAEDKSMALSPDGLRLASASADGLVRLWDTETGNEIAVFEGHLGSVCAVEFSPDGSRLASASEDTTVRLWSSYKATETAVFSGHSEMVRAVTFSPDGSKLASASHDFTVRVWDAEKCTEIAVFMHWGWVVSVAFSPDGSRLATGCYDQGVRLVDCETWSQISVHQGHGHSVRFVVFSPDGSKFASGSYNTAVRLWDGLTGNEIAVLEGHLDGICSVAFSPDGLKLASASDDDSVRLWNGQISNDDLFGRSPWSAVRPSSFSPDGSRFASASSVVTMLYDGPTGNTIAALEGHSEAPHIITFSSDGSKLASASRDNTVQLWDGQTGAEIAKIQHLAVSLAFSPDGLKLALSSTDGAVRLWDSQTGTEIAVFKGEEARAIVFSADGSKLASSEYCQDAIKAYDLHTGSEIVLETPIYSESQSSEGSHSDRSPSDEASVDETTEPEDHNSLGPQRASEPVNREADSLSSFQDGGEPQNVEENSSLNPQNSGNTLGPLGSPHGSRTTSDSVDPEEGTETNESDDDGSDDKDVVGAISFSPDSSKLAAILSDDVLRVWDCTTGDIISSVQEEIDEEYAPILAAFTSCGSRFFWMYDTGVLYVSDYMAGKTETVHLGIASCESAISDSDVVVALVRRTQPSLDGLTVIKIENGAVSRLITLCWFPPSLSVSSLAISVPHSRVVVGCTNGRFLLLEVDFSSL